MAKDKVIVIRGVLDWAKVIGPARPHTGEARYDKGPYWSVEVTPNDYDQISQYGLTEKLKDPSPKDTKRVGKGKYLSLKVLENKSNGEKNKPPVIVNVQGQPWDEGLLGNGTVADVKVKVVDYGKSVQKGCYLQAIRVLDPVIYEAETFAPLSSDDEYFSTPEAAQTVEPESVDEDLDDDIPF